MLQDELNKRMVAVKDLQILFKKPLHKLSSVSSKPQTLTADDSTAKSTSAFPTTTNANN